MKRILLVGNPTAQSGKNEERIAEAEALLRARGLDPTTFPTLPDGKTVAALAAHIDADPPDVVVAMGGDGTFREVGAAILASQHREDVPLGMLPTGTANDQGKSFGLEADDAALGPNIDVVLAGHETRLDAGRMRMFDGDRMTLDDVFFDSAGFGMMARALRVRNEDREAAKVLGPLRELYRDHIVYAGAFLKTFLASYIETDKFTAIVEADGVQHHLTGLTDLVLKGTRVYAGAWVFDPSSRHDDGQFELVPFCGKRDWTSKALLHLDGNPITEELLNAVGIEHSQGFRFTRLSLRFEPDGAIEVAAQMDGEEIAIGERVEVEVEPRALRLIVPG